LWGEDDKGIFTLFPLTKVSKNQGLIDWLVEILRLNLKLIVTQRQSKSLPGKIGGIFGDVDPESALKEGETVL
jgi:hypothetical protein